MCFLNHTKKFLKTSKTNRNGGWMYQSTLRQHDVLFKGVNFADKLFQLTNIKGNNNNRVNINLI